MIRVQELRLPLEHEGPALKAALLTRLGLKEADLISFTLFKRAADSRKKSDIQLAYIIDATVKDEAAVLKRFDRDPHVGKTPDMTFRIAAKAPADFAASGADRPLVVGFGPCGIFAALILAEMGFRPIVLERGKVVRERTVDTFKFWRQRVLDPASNVQFGEGGAGTFSDGKLYSQIRDPDHYGRKVLTEFVAAGAPEEILYVARPHIGTFRLVSMVEAIRAKIEALGGEIRFQSRVSDIVIAEKGGRNRVEGVVLENGEAIAATRVVLALGHSARDTVEMLHRRGVFFEPKPLSIGVRIEHPQSIIDRARYGKFAGNKILGAADYRLSYHAKNGRTVYSFCMCPGGTVVAAASEEGRLVTNGMSQYSREERNANSGLVVSLTPDDFPGDVKENPLAGIAFQRYWEELAYKAGGASWRAPAQLVGDFLKDVPSTELRTAEPSYGPGVTPADLSLCLPDWATEAIREALPVFGRQIKGYDMDDAVMTGVETRTSSPIRMTRRADHQSFSIDGLYPAGEGAGYAGGIYSAAIDGVRTAQALALSVAGRVAA